MIRIAIAGIAGRMGIATAKAVESNHDTILTGGCEILGHTAVGKLLSEITSCTKVSSLISAKPATILKNADVLIDFTTPTATLANLKECVKLEKAIVIGTTGMDILQKKEVARQAKKIPLVFAPNMSIGMNLMFKLVNIISKILDSNYALELVEAHHAQKKDAPSGSAIRLLEEMASARGLNLEKNVRYSRQGLVNERNKDEIGVSVIRGGDIIGDHMVYFIGQGERIELVHRVHSRDTFAQGAVRAACWVVQQKPGFYDMNSVLAI